jgi:Ca2+-binding RTX toxin-like protein
MPLTSVAGQANLLLSPEDGTSLSSAEYAPRITALATGGFAALWKDFLSAAADPDQGASMMLKRFGADGSALGPATVVSADRTGDMDGAGLATLGNGHVVAAWGALSFAGGTSRVGAVVIDPATGAVVGSEIAVASAASAFGGQGVALHQLVALSGNRAGVIYVDGGGPGLVTDTLKLRIVNADGTAGAVSTLLTQGTTWITATGVHDTAAALQGPNADVVALAVNAISGFSTTPQVIFRTLDGSAALSPFTLSNPDGWQPVLAARPDGGLIVAHPLSLGAGASTVRVYRLGADGAEQGRQDLAFPYSSFGTTELAVLPDGGFIVAISGYGTSGFDPNVYAQRVNADGSLDGGVVRLDATTQGQQTRPELAVAGNGSLLAAWEDTNNGFDYQIRGARFDLGLAPPAVVLNGTGKADALGAGDGADTLYGRAGDDTLAGGGGNDELLGQAGADSLRGEDGDDRLRDDAGADTLDGGDGKDTLIGGIEDDLLLGGAGNDALLGGSGADSLLGGVDADLLQGGDDGDLLIGEDGADVLQGGTGDDLLQGGAGADQLSGDDGGDTLDGGTEDDLLRGGDGSDLLLGGAGADRLFGDISSDVLDGGAGADTLRGGTGNDTFRYTALEDSAPDAADVIGDFSRGNDDIDVSALGAFAFIGSAAFSGGAGVEQLRVVRDLVTKQVRVELDTGDADAAADMVILLTGTVLPTSGDFLL